MAIRMCWVCAGVTSTGGSMARPVSRMAARTDDTKHRLKSYDARPGGHEKARPSRQRGSGRINTDTVATWLMVPGQVSLSV